MSFSTVFLKKMTKIVGEKRAKEIQAKVRRDLRRKAITRKYSAGTFVSKNH